MVVRIDKQCSVNPFTHHFLLAEESVTPRKDTQGSPVARVPLHRNLRLRDHPLGGLAQLRRLAESLIASGKHPPGVEVAFHQLGGLLVMTGCSNEISLVEIKA